MAWLQRAAALCWYWSFPKLGNAVSSIRRTSSLLAAQGGVSFWPKRTRVFLIWCEDIKLSSPSMRRRSFVISFLRVSLSIRFLQSGVVGLLRFLLQPELPDAQPVRFQDILPIFWVFIRYIWFAYRPHAGSSLSSSNKSTSSSDFVKFASKNPCSFKTKARK